MKKGNFFIELGAEYLYQDSDETNPLQVLTNKLNIIETTGDQFDFFIHEMLF